MLTHAYQAKRRLEVLPMAVLIHMTANMNRDPKQRPQPFGMDEVLGWMGIAPEPDPPPPPAPPSPDELRAKLGMLAQMFPKANGQQREGS